MAAPDPITGEELEGLGPEGLNYAGEGAVGQIITDLLRYIFPIAGLLLLLYLVYGGYRYMLSRGDPKNLQEAKGVITTALVGFIIVFLAFWIVQLVGVIFGIEQIRTIFGGPSGGGGGGGGCFIAGTKVKMADGTYKEIQEIKPGDIVYSYNLETGELVTDRVEKMITHEDSPGGYLIFNSRLKITGNHQVWVVNENVWERADTITVGDTVLNPDGKNVLIKSIDKTEGKNTVYNLHLNGENHNYFAEDFLVHNLKIP